MSGEIVDYSYIPKIVDSIENIYDIDYIIYLLKSYKNNIKFLREFILYLNNNYPDITNNIFVKIITDSSLLTPEQIYILLNISIPIEELVDNLILKLFYSDFDSTNKMIIDFLLFSLQYYINISDTLQDDEYKRNELLSKLQKKLRDSQQICNQYKQKIEKYESQYKTTTQSTLLLPSTTLPVNEQNNILKRDLILLNSRCNWLIQRLTDLEKENKELQTKLDDLEKENKELNERLLCKNDDEYKQQIDELLEKNKIIVNSLDLNKDNPEVIQTIDKLVKFNKELIEKLYEINNEREAYKIKVYRLKKEQIQKSITCDGFNTFHIWIYKCICDYIYECICYYFNKPDDILNELKIIFNTQQLLEDKFDYSTCRLLLTHFIYKILNINLLYHLTQDK